MTNLDERGLPDGFVGMMPAMWDGKERRGPERPSAEQRLADAKRLAEYVRAAVRRSTR